MSGGIPQTPFDVRRQIALENRCLGYRSFQVERFVRDFEAIHGRRPKQREIADACEISTTGEVSRIMARLERRGIVPRLGPPRIGFAGVGW